MKEISRRKAIKLIAGSLIPLGLVGCSSESSENTNTVNTGTTKEDEHYYFGGWWTGETPEEGATVGTKFTLEFHVQRDDPTATISHVNITTPHASAFPDKIAPNNPYKNEVGNSVILASLVPNQDDIVTYEVDAVALGIPFHKVSFGSDIWGHTATGQEIKRLSPNGEKHVIINPNIRSNSTVT